MDGSANRWTVHDRDGNPIYLSEERWTHILAGHPEMDAYENHLQTTLKRGRRHQEPLNPRKYRYAYAFDGLPYDFNHVAAVVLFGVDVDEQGQTAPNNYVATAFMKHIRLKGN